MKLRPVILLAFMLFAPFCAFSQGLVSVDKPTGAVRVGIPLYTLNVGNVSLPISLSYANSGIRATDIEGSAGIGWNLVAGGAISRQVRGLPDDISTDNASAARTGWINSTNGNTINTMAIANSSNPPVYTNVATDVNFINSHFQNSDTEPDIFNVSAPGLSLQFVFDKDHIIRTIPYQDVKITYTTGTNGITSFAVTNDQGITYVFSAMETTIKQATHPLTTPSWFLTDYNNYYNGVTYTTTWQLTQMHDRYNNAINLNYSTGNVMMNSSPVTVYLNGSTTGSPQYTMWQTTTPQLLSSITYQEGNGTGSPVTAFTFYSSFNLYTRANYFWKIVGMGRSFLLTYTANVHSGDNYTRYFLTNVTDADCNTPVNYDFSYNSLASLPDSTSTQLDYWGYINGNSAANLKPQITVNPSNTSYDRYYNPVSDNGYNTSIYPYKINGYSRWTSPTYITIGALSQVNYATGGYTTIGYEPNDFYDNTLSLAQQAGGIRVNQISNYDGINASPTSISYSYTDPSTGQSSGKTTSLPIYAFTQAYTSSEADSIKWRKSTVVSWSDLSQDDHSVLYSYVRESRTGAGSTLYQFSTPVTEWDSSTLSGAPSWSPTTVYAGAPTNISIGFLNNTTRMYPFPPSTNYDFERGLPLDVTNYDGSGNKVSETTNTYTTPQTPITITAFKYDINTSAEESYAKYSIYTTAGPLTTQVVNKLFSQAAPTTYRQTTDNYYYAGASHKLLTHAMSINSDNTQTDKYIKYVKDYVVTTSGDAMTQALLNLQAGNINAPIEEYTQVTPSGGSATTVSADIVKYSSYSPSGYTMTLPSQHLKIANPNGTTFTPSSVTGSPQTFVYDNTHYTTVENDLAYDYSGYLLSSDNGFKHRSTVLIDHNSFQPAATIDNTRYDKIAFSDFDSNLPYVNFTAPGTLTSTSRSGQYAESVAANATFTKTVVRDSLASNYIISAWIQCTGTAGTISATISGGGQSGSNSVAYQLTTNPTTYPTGWQYVEFKVPIGTITVSSMTISVTCSTAVLVDDLWAYPDVAEVSSVAHDPVAFFKTAVTNTNGVASYYSYDKFGRLLYAYDQDKNIVQRKIYASAANEANFNAPALSGPTSAYNHVQATWSMATPSYNSCITASGVTYTWDFGDGTTPIVTSSYYPQNHTYTTNGTYTITLTVSSPAYGSKASTYTVTVSTLTQTAVSYNNNTTGSYIASVVFSQGGVTKYSKTTTDLNTGFNIVPGVYDITITPFGPQYNSSTGQGWGSISLNAGTDISLCFGYSSSAITSTGVNLTYEPTLNFSMNKSAGCP